MSGGKKKEEPEIVSFSDHEVITPPNQLKKAIAHGNAFDDPVARAEQALAALSTEFPEWMDAECDRLDAARLEIKKHGLGKSNLEALFLAAHDIKGQASTFGFPFAGTVADSLCRLIENTDNPERIPLALIDQHVDAVRAIIREYTRSGSENLAAKLTFRLTEVTDDFLRREGKDLTEIGSFSPSLVPGKSGR